MAVDRSPEPRSRWVDESLIRYTAPPRHDTISIVLVMLGTLYLSIPFIAVSVMFYRPQPLHMGFVAAALVAAILAGLCNIRDIRGFRRGDWARYNPLYNLAELFLGFVGVPMLAFATGDQLGLFRPLLFLTFLLAIVIFDGPLLLVCFVWCMVALGSITWVATSSGVETFWVVFVYAAVWGIVGAAIHYLVRRVFFDIEGSDALAQFASQSGSVATWDADMAMHLPTLARALYVDRVAVALSTGSDPTKEFDLLCWPTGWIDHDRFVEVTGLNPEPAAVMHHEHLIAVQADASQVTVALVADEGRTILRTPINAHRAVTAVTLLAGVADRLALVERLHSLALTDELTGLANRRRLFDQIDNEIDRSSRSRDPLSLAMLDLDHFKLYNDSWGHQAGDALLRHFATVVGERIRVVDLLARYGGEEFCLVMPATALEHAAALIDEVRQAGIVDSEGRTVTFSAGVSEWGEGETATSLIRRADLSLYAAKENGRDRVVVASTAEMTRLSSTRDRV